jgi:hypothetical protein
MRFFFSKYNNVFKVAIGWSKKIYKNDKKKKRV